MARIVLDTNLMIAVERGKMSLEGVIETDDDVAIAAITAAELLIGIELADDAHREPRRASVEQHLAAFTILDYTLAAARWHARLIAQARTSGKPRGSHDLIIAATAIAADRTVLTLDAGFTEMPGVDVRLLTMPTREA